MRIGILRPLCRGLRITRHILFAEGKRKGATLIAPFILQLCLAAEAGGVHLLAGGVGGGADALAAQLEVVRISRAFESRLITDQALGVEVIERLVKALHTVLGAALSD